MVYPIYKYKRLKSARFVRVLILEPAAAFTDPLRCRLEQQDRIAMRRTDYEAAGYYEAVSHVWGAEPTFDRDLVVDNRWLLKITADVAALLRWLRLPDQTRNLWVDSVCLDQANAREKAVQVPMMGDIYHKAVEVHIWLGDDGDLDDAEIQRVFVFFEAIQDMRFSHSREQIRVSVPQIVADIWPAPSPTRGTPSDSLSLGTAAVTRLLSRPWFRRRWVLQEASRAWRATVWYRNNQLDWSTFKSAINAWALAMDQLGITAARCSTNTAEAALVHQTINSLRDDKNGLLGVLWMLDHAECSEPQDRVFALLGLVQRNQEEPMFERWQPSRRNPTDVDNLLELHYSIPTGLKYRTPWQETFTEIARHYADLSLFLLVIRHLEAFGSLRANGENVPSWVPDWRKGRTNPYSPPTLQEMHYLTTKQRPRPYCEDGFAHDYLRHDQGGTSVVAVMRRAASGTIAAVYRAPDNRVGRIDEVVSHLQRQVEDGKQGQSDSKLGEQLVPFHGDDKRHLRLTIEALLREETVGWKPPRAAVAHDEDSVQQTPEAQAAEGVQVAAGTTLQVNTTASTDGEMDTPGLPAGHVVAATVIKLGSAPEFSEHADTAAATTSALAFVICRPGVQPRVGDRVAHPEAQCEPSCNSEEHAHTALVLRPLSGHLRRGRWPLMGRLHHGPGPGEQYAKRRYTHTEAVTVVGSSVCLPAPFSLQSKTERRSFVML
ncbi:Heterokaryon incompatibility [Niveomyces insectorum RCEF 264]|uniref:Heterokaryon incompatibility n=1 Tax=Niveomyces insectorum RCEF 264 TaxID=1081102 RepID=A0A167NQD2_9HYPO|nr:Heterokaryon incompatibility [Niveomyces insectorum RCEF 264]